MCTVGDGSTRWHACGENGGFPRVSRNHAYDIRSSICRSMNIPNATCTTLNANFQRVCSFPLFSVFVRACVRAWCLRFADELLNNNNGATQSSKSDATSSHATNGNPHDVDSHQSSGILDTATTLLFTCDVTSDKVDQLAHNNRVELCWYLPVSWEQFRLSGAASLYGQHVAPLASSGGAAASQESAETSHFGSATGDEALYQTVLRQRLWASMSPSTRTMFMAATGCNIDAGSATDGGHDIPSSFVMLAVR
jgi:hypothetical protein